MEKTPTDKDYKQEQIDFYTEENEWLEEQKTKAEEGLQSAETDEDREKYQKTLEKIGRYMTQNTKWIAYFRGEGEAPIRTESTETAEVEAEDLDSPEEEQKSFTVQATNPYDGRVLFGKGATEEEARRDVNNQINEDRDARFGH